MATNWLVPDIAIILATIIIIFLIFLRIGTRLGVKDTWFRLWAIAWLFSIFHYVGQWVQATHGKTPTWGGLVNLTFLAYSAIIFMFAAESLRGTRLKLLVPYGALLGAIFTLWAYAQNYHKALVLTSRISYGLGLALLFGLAGVSHWLHQRRHRTLGATILAYAFFFWALCFVAFALLKGTSISVDYAQYMYQFSNLPKPIAAISMLIFLLEGERANAQRERDFANDLIQNAPDGIFLLDSSARLTRGNKRLEQIMAKPLWLMTGKPLSAVFEPNDKQVEAEIGRVLDGSTVTFEVKSTRDSDEMRYLLVTAKPIARGGQIVGAMGIVKDTTEQVALSEKLKQSEKMASIGLLVSGVAHELNNPLTSVLGFTELVLNDASPSDEAKKKLKIVLTEAKRTRNMVQRLLSAVRKRNSDPAPISINQIITDTVALREYEFNMNEITISTDLADDIPLALADATDIQQVLVNLLQNSFDAIKDSVGSGTIHIRSRYEDGLACVDVIDDGPGLEEPAKVFDLFYTTKEPGKGTGLGLSICYQLMKACGGEISAANLSHGVRFTFKIPAPNVRLAVDNGPLVDEPSAANTAGRILVIDDERPILELSSALLTAAGFSVETASTASEGIGMLGVLCFDAVVTDYKMPGRMNGRDVESWVKENLADRTPAMVFMTGDAISDETQAFFSGTTRKVIFKPFDPAEFVDTIVKEIARASENSQWAQSDRQICRR